MCEKMFGEYADEKSQWDKRAATQKIIKDFERTQQYLAGIKNVAPKGPTEMKGM